MTKPAKIAFADDNIDSQDSSFPGAENPFGQGDDFVDDPRDDEEIDTAEEDEPSQRPTKKKSGKKGLPVWMLALAVVLGIMFVSLLGLMAVKMINKNRVPVQDEQVPTLNFPAAPQPQIVGEQANLQGVGNPPNMQVSAPDASVQVNEQGVQVSAGAAGNVKIENDPETDYSAQAVAQRERQGAITSAPASIQPVAAPNAIQSSQPINAPSGAAPTTINSATALAAHAVAPAASSQPAPVASQSAVPVSAQAVSNVAAEPAALKTTKASFGDQAGNGNSANAKDITAIKQAISEISKRLERLDGEIAALKRSAAAAPAAAPIKEDDSAREQEAKRERAERAAAVKAAQAERLAKAKAAQQKAQRESVNVAPLKAASVSKAPKVSEEIVVGGGAAVNGSAYSVSAVINNRAFITKRNANGTETEVSVVAGDRVDGIVVDRVEGRTVYLVDGRQITVGRR